MGFASTKRMGLPSPARVALVAVVTGMAAFFGLGAAVLGGHTRTFDERAVAALRDAGDPALERGPRWLSGAARDVTSLGSVVLVSGVSLVVLGFALLRGNRRLAALVLLAAGGGWAVTSGLKALYDRPRPELPHVVTIGTRSFPSGHAMLSAAVYLSLAAVLATREKRRALRAYPVAVALVLTTAVGLSRVYLGYHYPTDVIAGWIVGLVWAIACAFATWASGERAS
jgi:undecaprenyl-diphosphatase